MFLEQVRGGKRFLSKNEIKNKTACSLGFDNVDPFNLLSDIDYNLSSLYKYLVGA